MGEVAERLKALVLKKQQRATRSWVRSHPLRHYILNSLKIFDTGFLSIFSSIKSKL